MAPTPPLHISPRAQPSSPWTLPSGSSPSVPGWSNMLVFLRAPAIHSCFLWCYLEIGSLPFTRAPFFLCFDRRWHWLALHVAASRSFGLCVHLAFPAPPPPNLSGPVRNLKVSFTCGSSPLSAPSGLPSSPSFPFLKMIDVCAEAPTILIDTSGWLFLLTYPY